MLDVTCLALATQYTVQYVDCRGLFARKSWHFSVALGLCMHAEGQHKPQATNAHGAARMHRHIEVCSLLRSFSPTAALPRCDLWRRERTLRKELQTVCDALRQSLRQLQVWIRLTAVQLCTAICCPSCNGIYGVWHETVPE